MPWHELHESQNSNPMQPDVDTTYFFVSCPIIPSFKFNTPNDNTTQRNERITHT